MNQKGQIFVISVFVSIIALSTVILLSSRYVKNLRSIVTTYNSQKALYVAESLAERLLEKSDQTLSDYVRNNNCSSDCYLEFEDGSQAYANISLLGDSSDIYNSSIKKDETLEINIDGYPVDTPLEVCWNEKSSLEISYISQKNGDYLVESFAYNSVASPYSSNFETATPNHGYSNCANLKFFNTPLVLRIKSLYESTNLFVVTKSGVKLPLQGFIFNIKGRFLDINKKISITKKYQVTTDILDYVIYQKSIDSSLSK